METPDRGRGRVPVGAEQDDTRFHHTTQNGTAFKTETLLFLEVLDHSRPWVAVTLESETEDNRDYCTTVATPEENGVPLSRTF